MKTTTTTCFLAACLSLGGALDASAQCTQNPASTLPGTIEYGYLYALNSYNEVWKLSLSDFSAEMLVDLGPECVSDIGVASDAIYVGVDEHLETAPPFDWEGRVFRIQESPVLTSGVYLSCPELSPGCGNLSAMAVRPVAGAEEVVTAGGIQSRVFAHASRPPTCGSIDFEWTPPAHLADFTYLKLSPTNPTLAFGLVTTPDCPEPTTGAPSSRLVMVDDTDGSQTDMGCVTHDGDIPHQLYGLAASCDGRLWAGGFDFSRELYVINPLTAEATKQAFSMPPMRILGLAARITPPAGP
ncbi:MAG: hypothetical protein AAF533_05040 [Acidobacteriota bacterium]